MPADVSRLEEALRARGRDLHGQLVDRFMDLARQNASRRSGEMAEGVEEVARAETPSSFSSTVEATAEHSRWQDEGTGIYAGEGRIEPTSGDVLAFDWPAGGGLTIVRSVAGTPPTRWWQRTRDAWPEIVSSVA